ncbi:MAG TPA: 3-phosphoshikimate 1-carboxyvinyltransferase [Fimbriiglobus sp.]|jgi:3-phosphoshikimate 1-carboxyvinyltransferase
MSYYTYPSELEILPLAIAPEATVSVPGSKSITNRALVLAALSSRGGSCTLTGALQSEDTEVMIDCLQRLGFGVVPEWDRATITVRENESDRIIPAESAELFVANSGTTIRFLTAILSLGIGSFRLDGVPRMRERPIQDLLDALQQIDGVNAHSEMGNGCPPVRIESTGLCGGHVRIRADVSSQFLSGLLMAAPFAAEPMQIAIAGRLVSVPYVEMTLRMLSDWGFSWNRTQVGYNVESILSRPPTSYFGRYIIEPDASAASYYWAAAAITGGSVEIGDLNSSSLQGDIRFVNLLEGMGCRVFWGELSTVVDGRNLHGIDVDMNDISDTVMTLAAVACFAGGPTTIRNVAHIRHKETDRIAAIATELRKLGAEVEEYLDGLKIAPRQLKGCAVETYNDHRMAMSLALIGLKVPGVIIKNPGCVAKTYPGFWQDFEKLRT